MSVETLPNPTEEEEASELPNPTEEEEEEASESSDSLSLEVFMSQQ